jgi:hypothetical protein
VDAARAAYAASPAMPFLNSEVCYEGILGACHDDVQRLMFWTCLLSGAAGHTYGANGIWQLNQPGKPYGKSPHGGDYGPAPWTEAMNLPGSGQLGRAKAFLQQFKWWTMTPAPDSAAYAADSGRAVWGDWIWYPEGNPAEDAPVAPRWFRRTFDSNDVIRATLRVAADDRHTAYVNGAKVSEGAGWSSVRDVDVTKLLRSGRNVVAIRAENMKAPVTKNPAGLLCTLTIRHRDGREENIVSDSTWRAQNRQESGWEQVDFTDSSWPFATNAAEYGGGPWGRIADAGPYLAPYAAMLADGTRIIYVPLARDVALRGSKTRTVEVYDPATFKKVSNAKASGTTVHAPAGLSDWLLIVRPEGK